MKVLGNMKPLIIFYSRTGNTKKVAEEIASLLKADIEEIIPLENYLGIWGYIKACIEAIFKKTPLIKKSGKNLTSYNLIIIGSPLWAGTMASPVRTYLLRNKNLKKFIITS